MTNRERMRKEKLRKKVAEKHRLEALKKDPYLAYSYKFDVAKNKGWEFKEGALDKYSREEFGGFAALYALKAAALMEEIPAEEAILDEQLATSSTSIDQAVYLWNKDHPDLVEEHGYMTREKFRGNESFYFQELRSKYDDDAAYDLAMSY